MTLDEGKRFILKSVRRELKRLDVLRHDYTWWVGLPWAEQGRIRCEIADAERREVAYNPTAWANRPLSSAERMCLSRALEALQAEGRIMRIGDTRTVAVKLVEEI